MFHKTASYRIKYVGKAAFISTTVVVVDVIFDTPAGCEVGLAGQMVRGSVANYSHATYTVAKARVMIEPAKAVPTYIEETPPALPNQVAINRSWQFDPDYYALDGGYAPRAFEWNDPRFLRETQEFQLSDQEWIFKQGASWGNAFNPFELLVTIELTNLTIHNPLHLVMSRLDGNVVLSWATFGRNGITLESASQVKGPWTPVLEQMNPAVTNVVVTIPADQLFQFYRLRR